MSRPADTDSKQLQQLSSAKRGKVEQNPQTIRKQSANKNGASKMPSSQRSPGSPVESHRCSSPITVPADDRGKPASCVVDQLRPHLVMSRAEGRPVVRSPEQLRLHRALEELGWIGVIDEFNDAARLTNPSVTEPILITTNGTILAGFGRWRLAVFER